MYIDGNCLAALLCFLCYALLCFALAAFLLPPLAAPAGNGFDVRHHSGSVPPGQGRTEQGHGQPPGSSQRSENESESESHESIGYL